MLLLYPQVFTYSYNKEAYSILREILWKKILMMGEKNGIDAIWFKIDL